MMKTTPLENGFYYHVYNRGNNSEILFREAMNYCFFLSLLKRYITPVADVYAYCLLNNHFHLMIRIKENNTCSSIQAFSNLFNSYSKTYNKRYNRTGKLFQERFKRKLVDSDAYFSALIYYIHSNPRKHRFLKDFSNYSHSSYQAILSDQSTMIKRDEVLDWFGSKESFKAYHEEEQNEEMVWDDFI